MAILPVLCSIINLINVIIALVMHKPELALAWGTALLWSSLAIIKDLQIKRLEQNDDPVI